MPLKNMLISALLLGLFAVLGTGLVALTHDRTKEQIAAAERAALLKSLHSLIPPQSHDNDIYEDYVLVKDPALLGSAGPVAVYRARKDDEPVAAVMAPVAPDGYSGEIKLLVALKYDGTLAGVRVLSHRETPGLGDRIEAERSDWIKSFDGRSLGNPAAEKWKVRKDGGVFDQFTGATITPRAVVKAVYGALRYFEAHRQELFSAPANGAESPVEPRAGRITEGKPATAG